MCTLTWRPAKTGGYDLFFNRDELDSRGEEIPPARVAVPGGNLVAPRDGPDGGTWIALNASGVTLAVLNFYPVARLSFPAGSRAPRSRGTLCWHVAGAETAPAAVRRVNTALFVGMRPFHLLAFDADGRGEGGSWDGHVWREMAAPEFLTSSSFRSSEIEAGRRRRWLTMAPVELHEVEAFHWSHDPADGAASVCMRRSDARTRSIIQISVRPGSFRMKYWPIETPGVRPACACEVQP